MNDETAKTNVILLEMVNSFLYSDFDIARGVPRSKHFVWGKKPVSYCCIGK
jgi:hypothetical protein